MKITARSNKDNFQVQNSLKFIQSETESAKNMHPLSPPHHPLDNKSLILE